MRLNSSESDHVFRASDLILDSLNSGCAASTIDTHYYRLSGCRCWNGVLTIAGRTFRSRLILGTGKFSSPESMRDALVASGTEIVTVALRRADLTGRKDPFANILEFVDSTRYLLLPNTSGAMNAEEAVRLAAILTEPSQRQPPSTYCYRTLRTLSAPE